MDPVVRQMLLCDDVRKREKNPHKLDLLGVFSLIRPVGDFPLRVSFAVFLEMSGGRGSGIGQIRVSAADTDEAVYEGKEHTFIFGSDPIEVHAASVRIGSCSLDVPGLYSVDFMYNARQLAQVSLLVREPS